MKTTIENGCLVCRLKLEKPHRSTSGKSMGVASTRGPKPCTSKLDGKTLFLSSNVFYFTEEPELQDD